MSSPFCVADEEARASSFATCELLPEQRWPLQRLGEKQKPFQAG